MGIAVGQVTGSGPEHPLPGDTSQRRRGEVPRQTAMRSGW